MIYQDYKNKYNIMGSNQSRKSFEFNKLGTG